MSTHPGAPPPESLPALRLAAFGLMVACDALARRLADALHVSVGQIVTHSTATWCVCRSDGWSYVYFRDALEVPEYQVWVRSVANRVHRWGRVVVVVDYAPDGGGTTVVLDAQREVTGEAAAAIERDYERAMNDLRAEAS